MNRRLFGAFAALTLLASGTVAQGQPQNQVEIGRGENREADLASNIADAEQFILMAGVSNNFEIQSSQVALEKSTNADIKAFAQMMIDEHTPVGERLAAVVQQASIPVTPPNDIDQGHAEKMDDIRTVTGEQFDRTYLRWQINEHQVAVALFTGYSQNGDNDALKQFAAETLPSLQAHLTRLLELNAAMPQQ